MVARSEATVEHPGSEAPRRQRLEPEERRASLVGLGLELFGERRYEEVEVAEICERADISRALFYHYFGSKKAFYLATVERAVATFQELTCAADPARPLDGMQRNIAIYFDYVRNHPQGALVAVQGRAGAGIEVEEHVQPFRDRTHRMLISTIGEENVDPYVDLALWTWQDMVESLATRLIDQSEVSTGSAVRFATLALCNLLEDGFAASGRALPAVWQAVREAVRAGRSAAS